MTIFILIAFILLLAPNMAARLPMMQLKTRNRSVGFCLIWTDRDRLISEAQAEAFKYRRRRLWQCAAILGAILLLSLVGQSISALLALAKLGGFVAIIPILLGGFYIVGGPFLSTCAVREKDGQWLAEYSFQSVRGTIRRSKSFPSRSTAEEFISN